MIEPFIISAIIIIVGIALFVISLEYDMDVLGLVGFVIMIAGLVCFAGFGIATMYEEDASLEADLEKYNYTSLGNKSQMIKTVNLKEGEAFGFYPLLNKTNSSNSVKIHNSTLLGITLTYDCISYCPEENTVVGCEIGTCQRKDSGDCVVMGITGLDNRCEYEITAYVSVLFEEFKVLE